eukprot:ctg_687.g217
MRVSRRCACPARAPRPAPIVCRRLPRDADPARVTRSPAWFGEAVSPRPDPPCPRRRFFPLHDPEYLSAADAKAYRYGHDEHPFIPLPQRPAPVFPTVQHVVVDPDAARVVRRAVVRLGGLPAAVHGARGCTVGVAIAITHLPGIDRRHAGPHGVRVGGGGVYRRARVGGARGRAATGAATAAQTRTRRPAGHGGGAGRAGTRSDRALGRAAHSAGGVVWPVRAVSGHPLPAATGSHLGGRVVSDGGRAGVGGQRAGAAI